MTAPNERLWDFRCTAERLPTGAYRVRVVSASGRVVERVGFHPLHELIRIVGREVKHAAAPLMENET